jgi:hypothetical protein
MTDKSKGRPSRVDLRQTDFLANYLNPKSKTYNNIYQSALDAGYSKEYAENFRIKEKNWVSDSVGMVTKEKLVIKAKKVLDKSLDSADEKIAQDTAKFVAKTDIDFSEKQELTLNLPKPILGGISKLGDMEDDKD